MKEIFDLLLVRLHQMAFAVAIFGWIMLEIARATRPEKIPWERNPWGSIIVILALAIYLKLCEV